MPSIDTSTFLPSVRQAITAAAADATAKPNDAAANGRLGMILQAHDQLLAATVCYQRAELLDPNTFDWPYYRAVAAQGLGRSTEAVAGFREALKHRDYAPAKIRLGEALLAAGEGAAAATVFEPLKDTPAGAFGYARAANQPEYFEKAVQEFPQYGAAIFALAQHYQRAGRTNDAERLMREYAKFKTIAPPLDDPAMEAIYALNAGPTSLLRRAIVLESQGRLADAAELNKQALKLDPKLVIGHVNLISAYGRLNQPQQAEAHYREAVALDPNSAEAYYNFGVLCVSQNRATEAKAAFEKSIRLNPANAEAHSSLGSLLEQQGNLSAAAAEFQKAIELKPDFRGARFHLGRIYANQRRWDAAIAEFREIVRVEDDATPTYLYALGATLARSGDHSAAAVLQQARARAVDRGQAPLVASIDRDLARLGSRSNSHNRP